MILQKNVIQKSGVFIYFETVKFLHIGRHGTEARGRAEKAMEEHRGRCQKGAINMRHYTNYQLKNLDGEAIRSLLNLYAHDDGGEDGDNGNDGDNNGNNGNDGNDGEGNGNKGNDGNQPRTYTDSDVDAIVAKKFAKWQKEHEKDLEKAREEARKYERMTKEQKAEADKKKQEEEAAKKDKRIQELESQIATDALRKSVAADVEGRKEGIVASQGFLDLVVTSSDADTAKKNVEKLVAIILADRKAQEEKRATGRTPKSYGGNDGGLSEIQKRIQKYKRN